MDEREHRSYEQGRADGYAEGYDLGSRGHLPPSSIVVVLPEGFEDQHEAIFQALLLVVHAEISDRAQVFRLDDLVSTSSGGVRYVER